MNKPITENNVSEITLLLQVAKDSILEASRKIRELEVSQKVGEEYVIDPEFEKAVKGVYEIEEAITHITTERKEKGSLDLLKDYIKESLKNFFKEQSKQKRYEGDYMEIGYRVTERKSITDEASDQFKKIEIKPNTEAINEYMKATKSKENPDGLVPKGVIIEKFEYISWRTVINNE